MAADSAVQGARTVEKALEILKLFGGNESTLSLAEIASRTDLPEATARRLTKALRVHGFLVTDSSARQYHLGPAVAQLFNSMVQSRDLQTVALAEMEELRRLTNETVALYWLFERQRVCIMELVSEQPIRMGSGIGHAFPLYAGAPGKAILATLTKSVVDAELTTMTEKPAAGAQPKTASELRRELAEIRKLGYARSHGETVAGAAALAAPVRGPNGRAVASLNIAGPIGRVTDEVLDSWVEPLLKAAAAIESATR
ncbi:IclR family transcriptional regulator [Prauserella flavalba]|uniref:IclR family transcriptional regulator n=1 Tax=Prauserella flavalba TaxID=1477506 RepID=A0A318LND2_9PSEU|nr:IclR family transcriptional regulator [Prauserella flavalba]PXY18721.1 hypothetical protein BA062_34510 [Prauserella flavalba]